MASHSFASHVQEIKTSLTLLELVTEELFRRCDRLETLTERTLIICALRDLDDNLNDALHRIVSAIDICRQAIRDQNGGAQ